MIRPLAIGLAPNLEYDDIFLALKNILTGKIFRQQGRAIFAVKSWFQENLGFKNVFLLESGRSALFVALSALGLKKGDEVIIQAFTCVAVPNAVLWAGAKPIYADINKKNLGIDPSDLRKKITKKTRAIIIQHTFGLPASPDEIITIAKENKIIVIEDCAHCLKVKFKNKSLGSFGDMSIFSFGRDKTISSVFGGALAVNNQIFLKKTESLNKELLYPAIRWDLKQHFHSITMFFVLLFYDFLGLGKFILYLAQKLNLLVPPIFKEELSGEKPRYFPKKMSESTGILVLNQLKKIDRFNATRKRYCRIYNQFFSNNSIDTDGYPLLRYPILTGERDKLLKKAKEKKIILGTWYKHIVDPQRVDLQKIKYLTPCPTAEYVAQHIINLPTYPTLKKTEVNRITSLFTVLNGTIL